jgi:membrane protein YqaA with SNARE-associated domain
MGGPGLLVLGILDSSFLVMPLGNDVLVVALSASRHARMPYYAIMATAGSVLGCLIIDLVMRKGGEHGLERHLTYRRIEQLKRQIDKRAGWAVLLASLMPPPFPFTPFVAGAAALQYSRKKLLGIIGIARLIRFSTDGILAIHFGRHILALAQSPAVEYVVIVLIVIAIGGSVLSVYGWIKRSRRPATRTAGG